jgi:hypothetical protein
VAALVNSGLDAFCPPTSNVHISLPPSQHRVLLEEVRLGHATTGSDTGSTEVVGAVQSGITAGAGLTGDNTRTPELQVKDASLLDKDRDVEVLMQKKRVIYLDSFLWGCCNLNPCGEEATASSSSESLWDCKSCALDSPWL